MSAAGGSDAAKACDLTHRRCQPCEGGVPPLTGEQAQRGLAQLSGDWRLIEDGKALWRGRAHVCSRRG